MVETKLDTDRSSTMGLVIMCCVLMGLIGALAVGWNAEHEYHEGLERFHECQRQCGDADAVILGNRCKCVTEPEGDL